MGSCARRAAGWPLLQQAASAAHLHQLAAMAGAASELPGRPNARAYTPATHTAPPMMLPSVTGSRLPSCSATNVWPVESTHGWRAGCTAWRTARCASCGQSKQVSLREAMRVWCHRREGCSQCGRYMAPAACGAGRRRTRKSRAVISAPSFMAMGMKNMLATLCSRPRPTKVVMGMMAAAICGGGAQGVQTVECRRVGSVGEPRSAACARRVAVFHLYWRAVSLLVCRHVRGLRRRQAACQMHSQVPRAQSGTRDRSTAAPGSRTQSEDSTLHALHCAVLCQ